jgi:hypothetical protein
MRSQAKPGCATCIERLVAWISRHPGTSSDPILIQSESQLRQWFGRIRTGEVTSGCVWRIGSIVPEGCDAERRHLHIRFTGRDEENDTNAGDHDACIGMEFNGPGSTKELQGRE